MSNENNVQFVQKTKELLKEMGFEIKTTQLYEMYSKLIGEKNWNIAKTKKSNFLSSLLENFNLVDLVKNIENINAIKVIERIHIEQGHSVTLINYALDNCGITHIVQWNKDIKVAIMTLCDKDPKSLNYKKNTGKYISRLEKSMDTNNCSHGIIYTSAIDFPKSVRRAASDLGIEVVDFHDMLKIAIKIESNKEKS